MSTLTQRTIDAIRQEHDSLASVASGLTEDQLNGPSGASEWSIAAVLSHLGSGSEINSATLRAALGEGDAPDDAFNQAVWDRWNAMAPAEQQAGALEQVRAHTELWESLTPEQHASVEVPVGYLPAPLTLAALAGLRLSEMAHHGWDVRVGLDATAGLLDVSAAVLPEHYSGDIGFLLGFIGKADQVPGPVALSIPSTGHQLLIDDSVRLVAATGEATGETTGETTATFAGPAEAALRLITGRLRPEHTPAEVIVTGNVTLDELRSVFPGF
ncbi:MAG: maleylpyruvate isomerase N-terminal domain-containing protein [Marmoricola sp.]